MPSYTITIAPNDDSGTTTTLTVDTSGSEVRVTDVHLHADTGLVGGQMPMVDVGLLLQAVNPAASAPKSIVAAPADHRVTAVETPEPAADVEPHPAPVDAALQDPPAAAPTPRRRAAKPAAVPAQRARSRRAATPAAANAPAAETTAPPKAAGRKRAAKASSAQKAAGDGKARVYRRTPADFTAVFKKTGSAAAVAEHYGVPRYTAQGWIQRLRKNS